MESDTLDASTEDVGVDYLGQLEKKFETLRSSFRLMDLSNSNEATLAFVSARRFIKQINELQEKITGSAGQFSFEMIVENADRSSDDLSGSERIEFEILLQQYEAANEKLKSAEGILLEEVKFLKLRLRAMRGVDVDEVTSAYQRLLEIKDNLSIGLVGIYTTESAIGSGPFDLYNRVVSQSTNMIMNDQTTRSKQLTQRLLNGVFDKLGYPTSSEQALSLIVTIEAQDKIVKERTKLDDSLVKLNTALEYLSETLIAFPEKVMHLQDLETAIKQIDKLEVKCEELEIELTDKAIEYDKLSVLVVELNSKIDGLTSGFTGSVAKKAKFSDDDFRTMARAVSDLESRLHDIEREKVRDLSTLKEQHQADLTALAEQHCINTADLADQIKTQAHTIGHLKSLNSSLQNQSDTKAMESFNLKLITATSVVASGLMALGIAFNRDDPAPVSAVKTPVVISTTTTNIKPSTELKKLAQAEINPSYKVGQLVEGKGVYLGARDRVNGITKVSETWNYFAAPKDLTDDKGQRLAAPYTITSVTLRAKKDFFGHNGEDIDAGKLGQAFDNKTYKGGWFIDNVYGVQDQARKSNIGSLKGTYNTSCDGADKSCRYWSNATCAGEQGALAITFKGGVASCWTKDESNNELASRPVRAEHLVASRKR